MNMKKHREIIVNDIVYAWILKSCGKEKHVRIWKAKKPILSAMFRQQSVTPKDIETLIREQILNQKL